MKIKDVINMANLMEQGNVLPKELAILFLSELDGMIQSDIMLHAPEEIVSYDNEEQELLLRPPHDKIYVHYLVMMIRNQQQEYEGYQNTQASVEEKLKTFRRWYVQHYRPADSLSDNGAASDPGTWGFAYITAYGLAVKHGYQGSEEAWLQSLQGAKGEAGEAARMRYDAERDMIQWGVGEQWHDLYTMAEVLAPLYAKLEELTGRAEAAAETAGNYAQSAQTAAEEAKKAAEEAKQAASSGGSGGGVRAEVEIVDGIEVVTAAAGAVTVTVVDGIEVVG